MRLSLMALITTVVSMASGQGGVLRQGSDGGQSIIVTDKTRSFLKCGSGEMSVRINFTKPFRGLMYAQQRRSGACTVRGSGSLTYEITVPLRGCGTWQESSRVFMNNVTIRFHAALELEEDETLTVICRYPPPKTSVPADLLPPFHPTVSPSRVSRAKLSEVEILIIICLLLFFSLLTLGIGIAYFCLKRRNIRLVRKVGSPAQSSPSTRLSSIAPPASSLLSTSVRIPRAVPYSARPYRDSSDTSGETSESSLGEDQVDANVFLRQLETRPLFTIPKAVLRHTEQQTVTTVLEQEEETPDNPRVSDAPVYAKVLKRSSPIDVSAASVHGVVTEQEAAKEYTGPKRVLIHEDIYLTETTETEELTTTTVTARDFILPVEEKPNFSVIIRQRPEILEPHFDVKIRSIPPGKEAEEAMPSIPELELPNAVRILKDMHQPSEEVRRVRWQDGGGASEKSTASSSGSLRERSCSEVLEVAPTLPSQQRPVAVRPLPPVLEHMDPDFLANIPAGGLFR